MLNVLTTQSGLTELLEAEGWCRTLKISQGVTAFYLELFFMGCGSSTLQENMPVAEQQSE